MFLDESGIATDLIRRYGRSRRGTRLPDQAPHGRWQSHTFIAAVRLEGITAPGVIDGPLDGVSFLAYVEQILVPTLRPGDLVILDNLTVHHDAAIRIVIEQTGATLRFLPPYSPDFNPIELCFAKLKAVLRTARPAPSTPSVASSPSACRAFRRTNAPPISDTAGIQPLRTYEKRYSQDIILSIT